MIQIQNIYYMLAYAFRILQKQGYKNLAAESFEHTGDLLSAILEQGLKNQVKRGLLKDYREKTEPLSGLRGRIEVSESIKQQTLIRHQLICTYDEFSVDSYKNRILKTTLEMLLRCELPQKRRQSLRRLLAYFTDVSSIDPKHINWHLRYDRNDQTYRMLIAICYLILNGLIQTTTDGKLRMMDFLDDQRMCRLYEKFILEYFRQEHPEIRTNASQVKWALDDDMGNLLPMMQTDVTLRYRNRTLIIDAKFYGKILQRNFKQSSIHSGNLYQIFTYVKNERESGDGNEVSGMLLYAGTDEDVQPDQTYRMSGNTISVKTLHLDRDFEEIRKQLDGIAEELTKYIE